LEKFEMKKSLIALAVLAASGAAMAQSSVTLYGKVDNLAVISDVKGKPSQTLIQSGGGGGSRWGMKGSEDLGGGLKANFILESGFSGDTGASAQGGLLFGRQAWVGVSGGFGDVQVGRVRTVAHIVSGDFQGMLDSAALAPLNQIGRVQDNGGAGALGLGNVATLRLNNGISYTTPKMSGFSARAQYALGENNAAGTDADAAYAFSVSYAGGPLAVGAYYQVESCETAAAKPNATPACAVANSEDRQYAFVGVKYNLGMAVLKGSYGHAANIRGVNNADSSEYQIGVDVPVSSALVLTASYANAGDNGTQSATVAGATGKIDREGYAVGAKYSLSKRTFMYAGVSYYEQTKAGALNNETTLYALGLQHNF